MQAISAREPKTLNHEAVFGLWGDRGETALDLERNLRQE
jgi:hypothetical protein